MANTIVTVKIMPTSPEVDLEAVKEKAMKEILAFNDGKETKTSIEDVAFGLKSINLVFVMDEDLGSTEELEEKIKAIEHVASVEVIDVRRAIG